jgi:eight-cysteine-cluster-containing protein
MNRIFFIIVAVIFVWGLTREYQDYQLRKKYSAITPPVYPTITTSPISPIITQTQISPIPHITSSPKFCGGIAGVICPAGYYCKYDGKYPDAGGTCLPEPTKETPPPINVPSADCQKSGCSGEICQSATDPPQSSICILKKEFACLKLTRCEIQADGNCGWTKTPEYLSCLKNSNL